jgi:hypothetical protein
MTDGRPLSGSARRITSILQEVLQPLRENSATTGRLLCIRCCLVNAFMQKFNLLCPVGASVREKARRPDKSFRQYYTNGSATTWHTSPSSRLLEIQTRVMNHGIRIQKDTSQVLRLPAGVEHASPSRFVGPIDYLLADSKDSCAPQTD